MQVGATTHIGYAKKGGVALNYSIILTHIQTVVNKKTQYLSKIIDFFHSRGFIIDLVLEYIRWSSQLATRFTNFNT